MAASADESRLPALAELNQQPVDAFRVSLRPLFEAAQPLSDRLARERPFTSYQELIERASHLAHALPPDEQLRIVNSHPRIGAPTKTLSPESAREQSHGVDSPAVLADLERLNAEYESRFGFRFLIFVNGRSKAEIRDVLRDRLRSTVDAELRAAIDALFLIARDRLTRLDPATR
jgi:2-oxo-4-hydroxy-4-carboxy--5-ureidoimidazoline (OHCU) decarboxylase